MSNHLTAPSPPSDCGKEPSQSANAWHLPLLTAEVRQDKCSPKWRPSLISWLSHPACLNVCLDMVKLLWLTGLLFVSWAVTAAWGMNCLCVYEKTTTVAQTTSMNKWTRCTGSVHTVQQMSHSLSHSNLLSQGHIASAYKVLEEKAKTIVYLISPSAEKHFCSIWTVQQGLAFKAVLQGHFTGIASYKLKWVVSLFKLK